VDATDREFPDIRQSQIVFASDLTRTAWASALPPAGSVAEADAAERETAQAWQRLAQRATVVLEDVDDGVRGNVAVVDVDVDPPLATLDSPLVIGVRVQSMNRAGSPLEVELLLDGSTIGRQTIEAPPGQSVVARFETQIIE